MKVKLFSTKSFFLWACNGTLQIRLITADDETCHTNRVQQIVSMLGTFESKSTLHLHPKKKKSTLLRQH